MKTFTTALAVLFSIMSSLALADTFGSGANTFNIDFVSIGNPGNAADTTGSPNPAGSVAYAYRIGKYEISEQMIDKANALGGLGITKDTRGADKPATGVNWNEVARFINWLNIGVGSMPAYKFAAQPGESGYDPNADVLLWSPADAGYNANNLYRNNLARYFMPSLDEWYKAAYFYVFPLSIRVPIKAAAAPTCLPIFERTLLKRNRSVELQVRQVFRTNESAQQPEHLQ